MSCLLGWPFLPSPATAEHPLCAPQTGRVFPDAVEAEEGFPGASAANLFNFTMSPSWSANSFNFANKPRGLLVPLRLQMGPTEVRKGEVRAPSNEVFELGLLLVCAAQRDDFLPNEIRKFY